MKKLYVETGRPYEILIERGLLKKSGELVKSVSKAVRAAVISDSNVMKLYGDTVVNSLKENGFITTAFEFEAGEASKRLSTIEKMYSHLADNNFTRKDIIVALGGGVTGDMAGFCAATFLRGIDFVQIPTSLLAQVDSSVGGKTGVDIAQGKNLVGAFWQPNLVIIDPDTLSTLPEKFICDGMAEVIKYGCIKDKALFEKLESENAPDIIEDVIYNCVSIKRDVVSRDERDTGERALLNFGHTLGHALEKLYGYSGLTHGQGVAIGMVMMTKASENKGATETGTADRIARLCKKYGLPISDSHSFEQIASATSGDKKSSGRQIELVILDKIGESRRHKINQSEICDYITV